MAHKRHAVSILEYLLYRSAERIQASTEEQYLIRLEDDIFF